MGLNYALLAVASLRSKRAPFPFNNPLVPTTLEVHANVLAHSMRFVKSQMNFSAQKLSEHQILQIYSVARSR